LVPSLIQKVISGWTNYSCKVTSQRISVKKMGNRGTKSDFISVKAQRINGSWCIKFNTFKIYS
jgi:hypothetical protein